MKIFSDNNQPLTEMAQFRGFSITIEIRSNDHGVIGSKSSPAYAHILDSSDKEIAKIVLTVGCPKKSSDIDWYRTLNPPVGLSEKIIKLVNSENKLMKKIDVTETIWQSILRVWITFHGK